MRLGTSTKLALASLACRSLLPVRRVAGLGAETEVTRDGIRWHLDLTEGIDLAIYLFGRFERSTVHVFRKLIQPGDTVLDIGANIGANTLELARCVGANGRIVAFEPTLYALDRLRRNLALNPELATRVTLEQAILGADDTTESPGEFYSSWPLAGAEGDDVHERHRGRLRSAEGASQWTLDRYVEEQAIASLRLIKLDVDGHERGVLEGSRKTLETLHPTLVMELAPYVLDETEGALDAVLEILTEAGYGITDIATGKPLRASAETLRAEIPDGSGINVLATRT